MTGHRNTNIYSTAAAAAVAGNFAPVVSLAKVKGVECKSGPWAAPGGTHTERGASLERVVSPLAQVGSIPRFGSTR